MTNVTIENVELLALDKEGAGRNAGKYAYLQSYMPTIPCKRAGIRAPDSGRTDIHPHVVASIEERLQTKMLDTRIHILKPEDILPNTLVIVLTNEHVPDFVFQQAFEVLLAPVKDPFPQLENNWDPVMTQMAFYAYLLRYVIENKFEELGKSRDSNGVIVPRELRSFEPQNWREDRYTLNYGNDLWRNWYL